jgi:O-antigen/teichoic acid export membrane protein
VNLAQKVAFNTTIQIVGRVSGIVISLLTLHVTTTYLGVTEFGELAVILAVAGLVLTISDLGVTTTLARELAKTPDDADSLAGNLLSFRLLGSTVLFGLTLAAVPLLPYSSQTKLGLSIYLVGTALRSVATFPKAFFQTNLQLHRQALIELVSKVLSLIAVVVVARADLGFIAIVIALSVVAASEVVVSYLLMRSMWRPLLRWQKGIRKPLVRTSLVIAVVSTVGVLHFRGDVFLLSLLAPAQDVGIYTVASQFISQSFILPGFLLGAVFPILTRAIHDGSSWRVDEVVNRTLQALALASVAVALGVLTLARPAIHLVAGAEFDDAVRPSRILALAMPFIFCAPIFYNVAIAVNRQRMLLWVGLTSLSMNFALNLILIPLFTYNGAAVATIVTEGVSFAGSLWVARRSVVFHVDADVLLRIAFSCLAGTVTALVLIAHSAFLSCLLGELVLLATAVATGALKINELRGFFRRGEQVGTGSWS